MFAKLFGPIVRHTQHRQPDSPEFRKFLEEDLRGAAEAVILDVRSWLRFGEGHFPGSWNVCLDNPAFAATTAIFASRKNRIFLVSEGEQDAHRAWMELLKAGFKRVEGFIESRELTLEHRITQLAAEDLKSTLARGGTPQMLDVRTCREWCAKQIPRSGNIPLEVLPVRFAEFSRTRPLVVICKDGFRSAVAASWLQSKGFESVHHLLGGMDSYEVDCPSDFSPEFWFVTA